MSCDIERRKSFDSQRRHPTLPSMNGWLYRSRRLHAIHEHAQNFGIRHAVQTTAESDLRADCEYRSSPHASTAFRSRFIPRLTFARLSRTRASLPVSVTLAIS